MALSVLHIWNIDLDLLSCLDLFLYRRPTGARPSTRQPKETSISVPQVCVSKRAGKDSEEQDGSAHQKGQFHSLQGNLTINRLANRLRMLIALSIDNHLGRIHVLAKVRQFIPV